MEGGRVEVAADPRGGFIVMVLWVWQNDDLKSIQGRAVTHVAPELLVEAVTLACQAQGTASSMDPFRTLQKRST